jgi:hypothetical protein
MDSQGSIGSLVAAGKVSGATPPVVTANYGCNAATCAVRNAKGDVTITLANQIDVTDRVCQANAGLVAGKAVICSVDEATGTDSTIHVITTDDAGAAQDSGFEFVIWRTAIG